MQLLKVFLALWLALSLYSCKMKTVSVRYEGRLVERYQVIRKSNVRHGLYEIYHENGYLAMQHNYENGKLEGIERIYHEDGSLAGELPLKNGDYHGHFTYYYPDGKVKQRGYYKNDMLNGEMCTYYRSGNAERCVMMRDNMEQGGFREYSSGGVLTRKGAVISYEGQEGLAEGLIYEYDPKSMRLTRKSRCKDGFCCPLWDREKGYLTPTTSLCDEIMNPEKKEESSSSSSN